MDAKDLIKAGRLSEARRQLTEEVKASPADLGKRTLLFQVLAFCGEWEKAENHLDAITIQDAKRETGVQVYKNLVRAEKDRMEVLKRTRRPSFLPETPPYAEMYFVAQEKVAGQKFEEARSLFDQMEDGRPVVSGNLDGKAFSGIEDTDTFFCFFLEAIVFDRYVWIPFESVKELSVPSPRTLFDLIWIQSRLITWEGVALNCYLPILYPDSSSHEDERIKLGRMTDWIPLGEAFAKGAGQHVYQIGDEEKGLLDIREILFKPSEKAIYDEKSD